MRLSAPAGRGERGQSRAPVAAEQRDQFVDREGRGGAVAGLSSASAQSPPKKLSMIGWPKGKRPVAGGIAGVRVADQVAVPGEFFARHAEEDLVGETERQRGGGVVLGGERGQKPSPRARTGVGTGR